MVKKDDERTQLEQDLATLRETHKLFTQYFDEWVFLACAYEGIKELIAWGVIEKHARESESNFQERKDNAYGFSYSKSVVDIFNSYLFKKEFPEQIPEALSKNESWKSFVENCDMNGTPLDEFFIDEQRNSSIQGHIGILIDRPSVKARNKQDEIDHKIYPYLSAYKPTNILDWEYEIDDYGRRKLSYIKVLDDDNFYHVWWKDRFEVWEVTSTDSKTSEELKVISEEGTEIKTKSEMLGMTATKIRKGENPLGEIPWVWLFNQRSTKSKDLGSSDITDVARIDASIIRNLSQIEQIIDYGAFPMMRKPKLEAGDEQNNREDEVGPTAVLEFDPEQPESKPDWLRAEVEGPVKAILEVIAKKISEIYRSSNIGGMSATEISKNAKSGVALRTEFQLLNSKLVKKGRNVTRAKKQVVDFWLKWENLYDNQKIKDELIFDYIKTFELDDLATDLENILTSSVIVTGSGKYKKEIQKLVVRMIMPTAEDDLLSEIDKEIDEEIYEGLGSFFEKKDQKESQQGGDIQNQNKLQTATDVTKKLEVVKNKGE